MTRITIERPIIQQNRLSETELRNQWLAVVFNPKIFGTSASFNVRNDLEPWHLGQKARTIISKRVDWRERLVEVLDRWSGRRYTPGESECFLFACDCLDAMTGSRFYENHFGNWDSMTAFYAYCKAIGGVDYFDLIGDRGHLDNAKAGDLLQIENVRDGKLYCHWAICADYPATALSFTTEDLVQRKISELALFNGLQSDMTKTPGSVKVWHLRDPIELVL